MNNISAIIERAKDGTYCVYCEKEIFSGAGTTIEEAKQDMLNQMRFYKETAIKEGFKYPDFLDGEYEIVYSIDSLSLLKYYVGAGIVSLAGMEKFSGINQKQLWHYAKGYSTPRKAQVLKIEEAIHRLGSELLAVRL